MVSSIAVSSISLIAVGLVVTPGPTTLYLVSRTLAQGRAAGLVSLLGIAAGYAIYLAGTVAGVTALVTLVPEVLQGIRAAGTTYLLWLAWHALRAPLVVDNKPCATTSPGRLFLLGIGTTLLNPTIAVLYLTLLPQLIDTGRGHMALQCLILGAVQTGIMVAFNGLVVLGAGRIARLLADRPRIRRAHRWLTSTALGALAVQMLATG